MMILLLQCAVTLDPGLTYGDTVDSHLNLLLVDAVTLSQ